jgi:hypothetical protein
MEQGAVGLLALVALVVALAAWAWRYDRTLRGPDPPGAAGRRHTWRPRTPEDCPACRAAGDEPARTPAPALRAWAEVKGRRGRRSAS